MITQMHIQTGISKGITRLKHAYFTQPIKVADITEDKKRNLLQLMIMSASPGILDGDEYQFRIELDDCSVMELQTQAYQRLFTMKGSASQKFTVIAGSNSSFSFLPHPVVPHAGSSFYANSKILLSKGCELIWGEVLTCGRKLNGEVFLFTKYHCVTEIFISGKLVIKENLFILPKEIPVNKMGHLEGYTHQASFIYLNEDKDAKELINRISEKLAAEQALLFGITQAPVNGLILRVLGNKAEQLFESLKRVAAVCKE